eukprot:560014-Rhodomonas_salina.1
MQIHLFAAFDHWYEYMAVCDEQRREEGHMEAKRELSLQIEQMGQRYDVLFQEKKASFEAKSKAVVFRMMDSLQLASAFRLFSDAILKNRLRTRRLEKVASSWQAPLLRK